jgi:hypothetical protein
MSAGPTRQRRCRSQVQDCTILVVSQYTGLLVFIYFLLTQKLISVELLVQINLNNSFFKNCRTYDGFRQNVWKFSVINRGKISGCTKCWEGARGSLVVEALCYKSEGARSRPDEVNDIFNLPNSFSRSRPWGLLNLEEI